MVKRIKFTQTIELRVSFGTYNDQEYTEEYDDYYDFVYGEEVEVSIMEEMPDNITCSIELQGHELVGIMTVPKSHFKEL